MRWRDGASVWFDRDGLRVVGVDDDEDGGGSPPQPPSSPPPLHHSAAYDFDVCDPPSDFFARLAVDGGSPAGASTTGDNDGYDDGFFSVEHPLHERPHGVPRPRPKPLLNPEDLAEAAVHRLDSELSSRGGGIGPLGASGPIRLLASAPLHGRGHSGSAHSVVQVSRAWVAFADGPPRAPMNPPSSVATTTSRLSTSSLSASTSASGVGAVRPLKPAPLRVMTAGGASRFSTSSLSSTSCAATTASRAGTATCVGGSGSGCGLASAGGARRTSVNAAKRVRVGDDDERDVLALLKQHNKKVTTSATNADGEAQAVLALLKQHNKTVTTKGTESSRTKKSPYHHGLSDARSDSGYGGGGGLRKRPANESTDPSAGAAPSPPTAKRSRATAAAAATCRPTTTEPRPPRRGVSSADDAALKQLLSQHNRKVTAAAASHDINGRSIHHSSGSSSIASKRARATPPALGGVSRARVATGALR
jgi:hypothetical protein